MEEKNWHLENRIENEGIKDALETLRTNNSITQLHLRIFLCFNYLSSLLTY